MVQQILTTPLFWYAMLIINAVTFCLFGLDKMKARRGRWRTPEKTLLLCCVFGGSVGGWLAMYSFRHKTQHLKFKYGVPAILFIQIALLLNLYLK